MEVEALLDAKNARNLNLRENNVIWQGTNEPVEQDLLGLAQRALDIERPWPLRANPKQAEPPEKDEYDDAENDEQGEKREERLHRRRLVGRHERAGIRLAFAQLEVGPLVTLVAETCVGIGRAGDRPPKRAKNQATSSSK